MKKFEAPVRTNNGQQNISVMARDHNHARTLLEQHGRLIALPKMLAS